MVLIPQGNDGRDFGRQWFWKSLSVDIQEPEERGLKSRNDFFTGTRARKKGMGRSRIRISDDTISLEKLRGHFFLESKEKK